MLWFSCACWLTHKSKGIFSLRLVGFGIRHDIAFSIHFISGLGLIYCQIQNIGLVPGMDWATFAFNSTTDSHRAVGSTVDGHPIHIPVEPSCGFGSPAGCLWASANDISKLMQLFFREDVHKPEQGKCVCVRA